LLLMVLAGGVAAMVLALIAGALGTALLLRLGGETLRDFDDDALGAVQQVCELAFYAGAALAVA
jgi:adenosylcobinamide-GDP ribazoletransferase